MGTTAVTIGGSVTDEIEAEMDQDVLALGDGSCRRAACEWTSPRLAMPFTAPFLRRHDVSMLRFLLCAGLLFLTACAGSSRETPDTEVSGPTPGARALAELAGSNAGAILLAGASTAGSLPRFASLGSVTQSSARDGESVARDAARAIFDGQALAVTVDRGEGRSAIALDSARHSIAAVGPDPSTLPDRTLQTWTLLDPGAAPTLSQYRIHWSSADPTDYLAAGYWLHLSADPVGAEVGVFVDGPELSGAPVMPDLGQATYAGPAYGYYVGRYGTKIHPDIAALGVSPGSVEFGSFNAEAKLTADFGAGSISGCIGCQGGVRFSTLVIDGETGTQKPIDDVPRDYQIYLDPAAIEAAGTFRTQGVRVETSEVTITQSDGSWGGKFSTIQDGNEPRLAAATAVGAFQTDDGGSAAFIGTLIGVKE